MSSKKEKCIRILIAEGDEIVRYGLKHLLNQQNDFEVIAESSSCKETLRLTSTFKPDIIFLDLTLCDGESVNQIPQLKKVHDTVKVLIYSSCINQKTHLLALHNGAVGVLLKNNSADMIYKAIRSIHIDNELWINQKLLIELWKQNLQIPISLDTHYLLAINTLTPREKQIACLLSKGLKARIIGENLFITEKTVRNQLTTIYSKLGVKNQLAFLIKFNALDFSND